jgi:inhibitor of KinA
MRIEPLGDRALLVHLGDTIDEATLERVREGRARLAPLPGVRDVVAGYATLAVHYDPRLVAGAGRTSRETAHATMEAMVERALAAGGRAAPEAPRLVEVPVRYGGADGPDLDEVARHHGIDAGEVVARHVEGTYVVHVIGFVPGFPYLGGLDPRLATPRRATPRTLVPAGSVGIGGAQTGVYPIASPGGWQLIGRTPLRLFDARRDPPALLRVGDRVRFRAVDAAEMAEIERAVSARAAPTDAT